MRTRLTVTLEVRERAALARLALDERRCLRDQATFLILSELQRLGYLNRGDGGHEVLEDRADIRLHQELAGG